MRPTRRGPQRPWTGRIGAPGRQRHACSEGIRRAQQRPDIPRVGDLPERENHIARAHGKVRTAVDTDDARRVAQRRDLAEELRHDVLTGDQQLDRLDARSGGSLDEILALDGEEPGLVPLLPRREKLPDEPELLVLT